ncbi:pantothenate kinase [Cylindrospermum sp. FACHB-282]|uniref:pantothenate kinase n=1 Tax=Cylindrospermum sp. FACHB-282 TaxID=2692794 RepID=UPI001687A90D|nr:pantothenate kinase [Cylindrospermum sp. FACHB-282]MBD2384574.1 pantothenate kinase [Cylindrospermum sp. FACHB-282]
MYRANPWLGLMIGNSRLHWALFIGENLDSAWDTDYLPESVIQQFAQAHTLEKFPPSVISQLSTIPRDTALSVPYPITLASVVPSQTALWQTLPNVRIITLDKIPLLGVYPTLGIDRALALWGAAKTWGFPMLVIDAGTALSLTGADANQCLVGGAILPGLGLQLATLGQNTGQLPLLEAQLIKALPPRFALNTPEAIQSGVIYTLLAGIKDFIEAWLFLFPESKIALTGGDRTLLKKHLQTQFPEIATRLFIEQNLIFWGMGKIVIENY